MKITKKFGLKIKELRAKKKISQEKLAFLAGLHRTYVSDIERGNRNVSLINMEKLANALKADIKDLVDF